MSLQSTAFSKTKALSPAGNPKSTLSNSKSEEYTQNANSGQDKAGCMLLLIVLAILGWIVKIFG